MTLIDDPSGPALDCLAANLPDGGTDALRRQDPRALAAVPVVKRSTDAAVVAAGDATAMPGSRCAAVPIDTGCEPIDSNCVPPIAALVESATGIVALVQSAAPTHALDALRR